MVCEWPVVQERKRRRPAKYSKLTTNRTSNPESFEEDTVPTKLDNGQFLEKVGAANNIELEISLGQTMVPSRKNHGAGRGSILSPEPDFGFDFTDFAGTSCFATLSPRLYNWPVPPIFDDYLPLIKQPSWKFRANLSSEHLEYLEYYSNCYCSSISIGLLTSNYFIKTFLQLASSNEAIMYSLVSWGCLMKQSREEAKPYLNKAAKMMIKYVGSPKERGKDEVFALMAFYLIAIGWEVCSGDTKNWYDLMIQLKDLFDDHGGFSALLHTYMQNNDIQWLISDYQFHDILSSKALQNGTLFPMDEYRSALKENYSYGIDPLQGCLRPLYFILGDIINDQVALRREWAEIEQLVQSAASSSESMEHAINRRLDFYNNCQALSEMYETRVHNFTLAESCTASLITDSDDVEMHMMLFELYLNVCLIYIGNYISKLPTNSVKQQTLLLKCLKHIDFLLETRMKVSLTFLLLMVGILSVTPADRHAMTQRFKMLRQKSCDTTLSKIIEIVHESWELNPDGLLPVDWADIACSRGWDLYVG